MEGAKVDALLETLPNALAVPLTHKTALSWPYPQIFESSLPRKEGFEVKFSMGDGEADRTRVFY
jgi:hypothetical protein